MTVDRLNIIINRIEPTYHISIYNGLVSINNHNLYEIIIKNLDVSFYRLNVYERVKCTTLLLILSTKYLTYQEISDILQISRTTLISDQEKLIDYTMYNNLNVEINVGKGLILNSDEEILRSYILEFLDNNNYLYQIIYNGKFKIEILENDILKDIHTKITEKINTLENKYGLEFSKKSYFKLVNFLTLFSTRIILNKFIKYYEKSSVSELSEHVIKIIENTTKIILPNSEKFYINNFVESLEYRFRIVDSFKSPNTQVIARKFIERISNELNIPFQEDFDLFSNLSMHLQRNEVTITNYDKLMIEGFPRSISNDIIKAVVNNITILESYYNKIFDDYDINYISIYFLTSYEIMRLNELKKTRAALLTDLGLGTEKFLKVRIENSFGIHVDKIISSHEVGLIDLSDIDVIFSTVSTELEKTIQIDLNIGFSNEDISNINNFLDHLIIKKMDKKNKEDYRDNAFPTTYSEGYGLSSTEFLSKEFIKIKHYESDWETAIKEAGYILKDKDYINYKYIEESIDNIKRNGPYVIITEGVALPHSSISNNVKKTGFSLLIIRNQIEFGKGSGEFINFVIFFAAVNQSDHLRALFELSNLFNDNKFKNELLLANNSEEAANIIYKYVSKC